MAAIRDADWLARNGITLQEAAERMGCGESTARSRVHRQIVQAQLVQKGGRRVWMVDPESVQAFIASDTHRAIAGGQIAKLHAVPTEQPAASSPADQHSTDDDDSTVAAQLLGRIRALEARVDELFQTNATLRDDNTTLRARVVQLDRRNAKLRRMLRVAVDQPDDEDAGG